MKPLLYISIILVVAACGKSEGVCLKKAGEETKETRELGDFKFVVLYNNVDLTITQDSVNQATVITGKNLIPGVITDIQGDTLFIRDENRCHWARSFNIRREIELSASNLEWIVQRGAGTITTTNTITGQRFGVDVWDAAGDAIIDLDVDTSYARIHTGPADITYTGSTDVCYLYSSSTGFIDHEGLISNSANINNSGISDFSVYALNKLIVEIHLSGNVYYIGNPSTIVEFNNGTGELAPL